MLTNILEKALAMEADRIEIEYKDDEEMITAFKGDIGFGLGSINQDKSKELFDNMKQLKQSKITTLSGEPYRLSYSRYQSFGEWVNCIRWKKEVR